MDGTVDVWRLRFDDAPPEDADGASLDAEERGRARTFRFAEDAQRYTTGRSFLRRVLGLYLQRPPHAVAFRQGPHGKPALASAGEPLRFNASHSRTTYLLAVTHGGEVGVDVEDRRAVADRDLLARHVLTPAERRALADAAPADRDELFLRCWTRKEAVLKAAGTGLSVAPDRIDLGADPGLDAAAVALTLDGSSPRYRVLDLSRDAVIAALAVPAGRPARVRERTGGPS